MKKKRLYFDMDGVIVDFVSALKLQSEETLKGMKDAWMRSRDSSAR